MTEEGKNAEQSGYFRFCDGAKSFVANINKNPGSEKIGPEINFYWLCAQLGLIAYSDDDTKPKPPSTGTGNEMIDEFAGETRHHQILIRAFLMYRYLSGMNFGIDELEEDSAEDIEILMDGFLQTTGSHLKNHGMKELDIFAQKGWDLLEDRGLNHINDLETFLVSYVELLGTYC